MTLQAVQEMVNQDRKDAMEQKGFESRVELAAPPEVAVLHLLNILKLAGKHQEEHGWADWTQDVGKKMQDYAKSLMEQVGPTERDVVAMETDRNLIDSAKAAAETLQASKNYESFDYTVRELVDFEDDFGYVGTVVHNEYGRLQDAKGKDRKPQEFQCQRIVSKGIGVLVDAMNMRPEGMEAEIEVQSSILEQLGVEPDLLRKTDNSEVSRISVPRHNVLKDESSLWFPIGPGDKK